jgi:hypothetical protein
MTIEVESIIEDDDAASASRESAGDSKAGPQSPPVR